MKFKKAQFLVITIFISLSLFGQDKYFHSPSLEPVYEFPFNTAFELTPKEIIQIALEFSLCPSDSRAYERCFDSYSKLEAKVTSDDFMAMSETARAEQILVLMYQDMLFQYIEEQTRMDFLILDGLYNCVSSSVLYMALARASGLKVYGNKTPSHAFCTVYADSSYYDVECTNPMGFNPGSRKLINDDAGRYYVVNPSKYTGRQKVSDRMMISFICKNMVSLYNDVGDLETAVPLAVTRLVFLADSPENEYADARNDFDKICGNLSAILQHDSAYIDSLLWLDKVYRRWGSSHIFQDNYDMALHNAVLYMCEGRDFGTASEIFNERKDIASVACCNEIIYMIYGLQLESTIDGKSHKDALEYILSCYKDDECHVLEVKKRLDTLQEYFWTECVYEIVNAADNSPDGSDFMVYLSAVNEAKKAVSSLPESRGLKYLLDQCLLNYSVCIHNRFVYMYNCGDIDQAEKVLESGIENYPESEILREDLRALRYIQGY